MGLWAQEAFQELGQIYRKLLSRLDPDKYFCIPRIKTNTGSPSVCLYTGNTKIFEFVERRYCDPNKKTLCIAKIKIQLGRPLITRARISSPVSGGLRHLSHHIILRSFYWPSLALYAQRWPNNPFIHSADQQVDSGPSGVPL